MRRTIAFGTLALRFMILFLFAAGMTRAELNLPPEASAGIEKLYAGDADAAISEFRAIQQSHPDHPAGFLLEAEALWWKMYCSSAEFKYGMTDAWRRPKLREDQPYFALAQKVVKLAEAQLRTNESAEMHFYSGMGEALSARLYGLRGENRIAARSGVRAREHLLRARTLDPDLADADFGLGLYNYFVDTLSGVARILRFFMGIPGGSKKDGVKQLERAMNNGTLARAEARFYLAKNLRNYDQNYEGALAVITPLTEQYPANPLFALLRGDLYAKLARKESAAEWFRKAAAMPLHDAECQKRVRELARSALAALGPSYAAPLTDHQPATARIQILSFFRTLLLVVGIACCPSNCCRCRSVNL
jgi:tetratricopeptide (TPR) repeat protein